MNGKDLKAIVRQIQVDSCAGNVDAVYEHYTEDYFFHRPPFHPIIGKNTNRQADEALISAFTNRQMVIHEMVMEKDTVMMRYTWQADHTGTSPSLGVPATGKRISLDGCRVFHFKGSKVEEQWDYIDMLGLVQQFEIFPTSA